MSFCVGEIISTVSSKQSISFTLFTVRYVPQASVEHVIDGPALVPGQLHYFFTNLLSISTEESLYFTTDI